MYSKEPSSSGGMNSDPSLSNTGTVRITVATAPAITNHFQRRDQAHRGSYSRMRILLIGWLSSEWILPTSTALVTRASQRGRNSKFFMWVKTSRIAGSSVMARTAAMIIEKFLVYASGLKRRPSCASRVRTGRKETAITSRAKKLGPPTSFTAFTTTVW